MARTNSPLGQLPLVVPDPNGAPDAQADMSTIIALIEPLLNMRYTTRALRDAAIISPVNGMLTVITGTVNEIDARLNGQWVKIWPKIYSGTAAPSNSLGVPGDLYVKYT